MDIRYQAFIEEAGEAAERIRELISEGRFFSVFCHNDADGLSSGAIASVMLLREGARFSTRAVRGIEEILDSLPKLPEDSAIIITDMGSGYLSELRGAVGGRPLIILDHHEPVGEPDESWIHVNPHNHGIEGANEVSGAGVTYFVARALNESNRSYSPIAVVGALGDLQDKSDGRSLHGLNSLIVEDAVKLGLLEVSDDLLLYGRSYRPLHIALASTTSPFIPGISGSESRAVGFLSSLGIKFKEDDRWRVLAELSEEEKKQLYNGLMKYLASLGLPPSIAKELVGKVYELRMEEKWTYLRDAREFASLLNACGKTGKEWLGISVAMGARGETLEEAQRTLEEYRVRLAQAMDYVMREENRQELRHIVAIDGGDVIDERMISSVASIISSSNLLGEDKPLIAMASGDDMVKVSARASKKLVEMGLDLGEVMSRAAQAVGGRGGGHNIAAGAEIPKAKKALFLLEVDRIVGEELGGKV